MSMLSSKQASVGWQHRPERSNMTMLRIMSWISLRLGRTAGRIVLHGIAAYFLLFAPASRAASRAYLRRALGRAPGLADSYRHIFSFAATIHDRVYLLNNRFDLFDIEVEGEALMRELLADGKGMFLFGAHMGSFEVMRALGRDQADAPVVMAMYEENAKKLNSMLAAINPDAGQDVIGLGHIDSMLKISAALEGGALVGVLADRGLGGDAGRRLSFLGADAVFPSGPFRMAALMRRPVVFMAGIYLGGRRYRIRFERLADFSQQQAGARQAAIDAAMQRYAALLEDECRAHPYNWFNFFDFWRAAQQEAGREGK
jgi:predicted LPLAT superfamily acyltransferase